MTIRPLTLAAMLLTPAMAFALEEKRIANMFNPLATPADEVVKISILTLLICGAIFVIVAGLLAYHDLQVPPQAGRRRDRTASGLRQ